MPSIAVTLKFGIIVNVDEENPSMEDILDAANEMNYDGGIELGPFEDGDVINYSIEDD
jgi:hypothetical protein